MRRRTLRTCLSLMLVFAVAALLPLRATMGMAAMPGTAPAMSPMAAHAVHGVEQAAKPMTGHRAAHPGHSSGCDCGVHCSLCGVCHSTLSMSAFTAIAVHRLAPLAPRPGRLAAVYISPEPYPPRA